MSVPDSSAQLMIENIKRGANENVEAVLDYLSHCDEKIKEGILYDLAHYRTVPSVETFFATCLSQSAPRCDIIIARVASSARMKGVLVPLIGYCEDLPSDGVEVLVDLMLRAVGDDAIVEACANGLGLLSNVNGINKIFAAWHIRETVVDLETRFYRLLLRKTLMEFGSNKEWMDTAARLCLDLEIKALRDCAQEMIK